MTLLPCLFVFIFGASIGSFLNVVIYRLPAGISLLWPPSRCPYCLNTLRKHENVPILGWVWLKGRCAHCGSPISVRYPAIEMTAGLLFVLVFLTFGWTLPTWGYWVFLSWLLVLSFIDLDTMTLPNVLTQSGLILGLVFQMVRGYLEPSGWIPQLMVGIVAAVVGIWLIDLISVAGHLALGQEAMGGGDAKLMAMMGAWLGWKSLLVAGFLGCAAGAFVGGAALFMGWIDRRQPIPFGPFLALGAAIATIWGDAIVSAYLRLFFPTL
jgi:leader peptidase (prepilin peptidase) / N-methyltransferase